MFESIWVDLILVVMMSIVITQNFGLRDRLKHIEAKLDEPK